MGSYRTAMWESDPSGNTQQERWGGRYKYYVPTPLAQIDISLEPDVIADVKRAEEALHNTDITDTTGLEGLSRLLLRSEAVASSRIEGLVIGAERLVRAELQEQEPGSVRYDRRAADVLGNIRAMDEAVELASSQQDITIDTIIDIHRALLKPGKLPSSIGLKDFSYLLNQ